MPRRRTAPEIEVAAASRLARDAPASAPGSEPLRMLRRRGLDPSVAAPDLPLPRDASPSVEA
jgi:hypothetical protein